MRREAGGVRRESAQRTEWQKTEGNDREQRADDREGIEYGLRRQRVPVVSALRDSRKSFRLWTSDTSTAMARNFL